MSRGLAVVMVLAAASSPACSDATAVAQRTDAAAPNPDGAARDADACAVPCTGTCTEGRCLIELARVPDPTHLALGPSTAYVTSCTAGAGSLLAAPLTGGAPTTLVTSTTCIAGLGVGGPSIVVAGVDGNDLLVLGQGDASVGRRVSLPAAPSGVTVAGGSAYVTTAAGLVRVSLADGSSTMLATSGAAWTSPVADQDRVYVVEPSSGVVRAIPVAGGQVTPIAPAMGGPSAIVLGGPDVYVAAGYTVMKAKKAGGDAVFVTTAAGAEITSIASDDMSVYFASDGVLWKVAQAGGDPIAIATGRFWPRALAIDRTSVYILDASPCCGAVRKLSPK